ncbi:signal peptidase I [Enterococcus sp. MJM12]|uniref:Signal peptidase I n=1 Tax=Candidatus Enterococcus myersii TaxID=2815322 RepID=A0ABS3H8B8_9ENTE|nr:signal peptidase I [Enterococcus sp. MJM12]MBO0449160.1 signal peptidase I [Enterococcus sp. MJM12]
MTEKKQENPRIVSQVASKKKMRKKLTSEQIELILQRRRKEQIRKYWDLFLLLMTIVVCVLFLINVKAHQIVGESMIPTLHNGDRILIKKTQEVQRYDIVTFTPDGNDSQGKTYIKRVIGVPGDKFVIQGSTLYLFNQKNIDTEYDALRYSVNLPDSTQIFELDKKLADNLRNQTQIPKNAYFVLGDNRKNSEDSRIIGFVQKNAIEGVMKLRFYPFDKIGWVH